MSHDLKEDRRYDDLTQSVSVKLSRGMSLAVLLVAWLMVSALFSIGLHVISLSFQERQLLSCGDDESSILEFIHRDSFEKITYTQVISFNTRTQRPVTVYYHGNIFLEKILSIRLRSSDSSNTTVYLLDWDVMTNFKEPNDVLTMNGGFYWRVFKLLITDNGKIVGLPYYAVYDGYDPDNLTFMLVISNRSLIHQTVTENNASDFRQQVLTAIYKDDIENDWMDLLHDESVENIWNLGEFAHFWSRLNLTSGFQPISYVSESGQDVDLKDPLLMDGLLNENLIFPYPVGDPRNARYFLLQYFKTLLHVIYVIYRDIDYRVPFFQQKNIEPGCWIPLGMNMGLSSPATGVHSQNKIIGSSSSLEYYLDDGTKIFQPDIYVVYDKSTGLSLDLRFWESETAFNPEDFTYRSPDFFEKYQKKQYFLNQYAMVLSEKDDF